MPLVKAVQELSSQNDTLKTDNAGLKNTVDKLQSQMNAVLQKVNELQAVQQSCCNAVNSLQPAGNQNVLLSGNDFASLDQNQPNPFNSKKIIKYHLPVAVSTAQMLITDIKGSTLKTVNLNAKGDGQVTLAAGSLAAGTYQYSLIVDGKMVDSKKMVIVK